MAARVDTIDLDRFDVIRRLGLGGSGEVYEVLDKRLGRHVALKTVRCTTPEQIAGIKSEFRAIRDLRHPNLVSIGELFQHGDRWSFTMELVEGKDLATWFGMHKSAAGSGSLPTPARAIAELRLVLSELADAIRALHAIGKHHLDIKPSNVLVTEERRAVLIDYGLVGSGGVTDDGTMIGTLAYVAPERLSRKAVTDATDWYSFGVLVYQLLAGELPFGDEAAAIQHIAKLKGPPPREPIEWAPPDLVALTMALLDADPTKRPDAEQIIERLGARPRQRTPHSSSSMPYLAVAAPEATAALELALTAELSTAVVIDGDAGTGKTATLERFATEAAAAGALVLRTSAPPYELTAYRGLAGMVDAIVSVLRGLSDAEQIEILPPSIGALARVFPELARVPRVQHFRDADEAAPALAALIAALAKKQVVAIAIDDMHRWDADALRLLEAALPLLPSHGIAIGATTRGRDGFGRMVPRLFADGGLAVELVRLAAAPEDERARILRAIERLTPTARRLVDVLAASAVPLTKPIALEVARVPPAEQEACWAELTHRALVTDHGLDEDARAPVLDRMMPAMVDDWRRRIAPALESGEPALAARAYLATGDRPHTVTFARLAANEARDRGAVELATELLRMVIDAGEDTIEARLAWIESARDAGHAREAAEALVALALRDPAHAREHRRLAGLLLVQIGELDAGLALLHVTDGISLPRSLPGTLVALGWQRLVRPEQLSIASPGDPSLLPTVDLLWAVAGAVGMVDTMRGALLSERALALSLRSGDRPRAARAIASEATFRASTGAPRELVEAQFARAAELAGSDPRGNAWLLHCRSAAALLAGEWSASAQAALSADALFAQLPGTHWERVSLTHMLVPASFYEGELGRYALRVRRQLAEARQLGDRVGETIARAAGVVPLLARGDVGAAAMQIAEAVQSWPDLASLQGSLIVAQQANVAIAQGDGARGLAALDRVIPGLRRRLLLRVPLVRIQTHDACARAAIAARDTARARSEIALLAREALPYGRALARLHEGGLHADPAVLLDAARQLTACGMPMHAAFARTQAGEDPAWVPAKLVGSWELMADVYAPTR